VAKKTSFLYFIIPIVYVGVIGLLVYLQFAGAQPFSEDIGSLRISGRETTVPFARRQRVRDMEIGYHGLVFPLRSDTPVRLRSTDGRETRPSIETYYAFPDGIEIVFDGGLRLDFELEGSLGDGLVLQARLPEPGTVLLPVDLSQVSVHGSRDIPVLTYEHQGRSYHLTLPASGRIDDDRGYLHIPAPDPGEVLELRVTEAEPGMTDPSLYWFSQSGALVDEETFGGELIRYLNGAYSGWNTERYVMGEGVWSVRGGRAALAEELAVSWIAESLRRGDYQKARAFVSAAMDIRMSKAPGESFRYLASPYVGRLTRFKERYFEALPQRTERIQRLIRDRDPAVFRMDNLSVTILGAGMIAQIDELVSRLVMSVDVSSQDTATSLGMLKTFLQVHDLYDEAASYFQRFRAVVEERILPQIRVVSGRPWMTDEADPDLIDCLRTIQAGSCLTELGAREENPALEGLGRALMLSCLELSDEWGFIPRKVRRTAGDEVEAASGEYVAPEEIYRWIVSWPYLPKERPLFPQAGPGVWIWTAGEIGEVAVREASMALTLGFPQGAPHFVLIQGVDQVLQMTIGGTPAPTSASYQTLNNGWFYDMSTQSLLIKLTQSRPEERIELFYR